MFKKPVNGPLEVHGAVNLNLDPVKSLPLLKNAGVDAANVDLLLAFNSTEEEKEIQLKLPGREEQTITIAPTTLELSGTGTLRIAPNVAGLALRS